MNAEPIVKIIIELSTEESWYNAMMESDLRINLPKVLIDEQERLILRYLSAGRRSITTIEWNKLLAGFNTLHNAIIQIGTVQRTFRQVYDEHIDFLYANQYINRLLALEDVPGDYPELWADMAREIVAHLRQEQLYRVDIPETFLLLAYCLYFWESFAKGYAFEVEIFRDLKKSGIVYQAHDIRERVARLSAHDLVVLNLKGDIKSSSYFLYVGRGRSLPHDFYITRFYEGRSRRTLVVMLQVDAWNEIDGNTVAALLREATNYFPAPVQVSLEQGTVIIADYAVWKKKVLFRQQNLQE